MRTGVTGGKARCEKCGLFFGDTAPAPCHPLISAKWIKDKPPTAPLSMDGRSSHSPPDSLIHPSIH